MSLLTLQGVGKTFGGVVAVDNASIVVEAGTIHGLIGPNGSGKSTTLNLISGIYRPTKGRVFFKGQDITDLPPHRRAAIGLGRTFQNIRLFPTMTVLENVMLGRAGHEQASIFGIAFGSRRSHQEAKDTRSRGMEALTFLGIGRHADSLPQNLPYGHRRLVEIARVIASGADVVLLDEPAAGMNTGEKQELAVTIQRMNERYRTTVILVEHDMRLLMSVSTRVSVLNFGRLIVTGGVAEVQAHPEVIRAYLGESEALA
jgi:ABC-type branched-subunit amino acid transport system ATPase component